MCIIIYKPQDKQFPSDQVLKTCFDNNPHGAGFMFANGYRVIIRKGFMTYEAFKKALDKARKAYGEALPYVLHFRISTQAGVRADNCHPFPLSSNMDDLRALRTATAIGVAHNGIISLTSSYSRTITYSDTMDFITNYLSLIIDNMGYYDKKANLTLIARLIGSSRLAILNADKHCELIGAGWIEDGGCYYSNGGYKTSKTATTTTTAKGSKWGGLLSNYSGGSYYTSGGSGYGYGAYSNDYDYYDQFYNYAKRCYVFPSYVCPYQDDGDPSYCNACSDKTRCNMKKGGGV